jgi:hypothetical protein
MNSYFDYINLNSIHIIFDIKDKKRIILDPRSPTQLRSRNTRRQTPPKLSLEPAGEWEKDYPRSFINNSNAQYMLNSIVDRSSVPILS